MHLLIYNFPFPEENVHTCIRTFIYAKTKAMYHRMNRKQLLTGILNVICDTIQIITLVQTLVRYWLKICFFLHFLWFRNGNTVLLSILNMKTKLLCELKQNKQYQSNYVYKIFSYPAKLPPNPSLPLALSFAAWRFPTSELLIPIIFIQALPPPPIPPYMLLIIECVLSSSNVLFYRYLHSSKYLEANIIFKKPMACHIAHTL